MVPSIQPQLPNVVTSAGAVAALFKPGQVLEALVLGKAPDGMVALKIGDVVVTAQLPQALPAGTTLQLQVRTGGPAPQLAIVGTPQLPATLPSPVPLAPVLPLSPVPAAQAAEGPPVPMPAALAQLPSSTASPALPVAPQVPGSATPPQQNNASPVTGLAAPTSSPQVSVPATTPAQIATPVPVPQATAEAPRAVAAAPATPSSNVESSQPIATGPSRTESIATSVVPAPASPTAGPAPGPVTPQSSVSPPFPPPTAPLASTGPSAPAPTVPAPAAVAPPATEAAPAVATTAGSPGPPAPTGAQNGPAIVSAQAARPTVTAAATAGPEQASASPLLLAQGAIRQSLTVADLPRPAPLPAAAASNQPTPPPATPAAALTQMIPEALARQNSIAPLLASLAMIAGKPGALPEPVLRAALQVLGQRIQMPSTGPTGQLLETALAKSGVYLEASLAKGMPAATDLKSGLGALKGALAAWLGGNPAPVTPAQQAAPPLRGMPPRAEALDLPPLPDAPREAARALHSQADAALSRVKLMQLASLPDGDPVRAAAPELRMELPFLVGHELVMAQFQVFRDGGRGKAEGKRGWTMRFAMNFSASGEVGAEVGLLGRAVNVALWAADPDTATALEAALPELAPALAALGLEPGAVRVRSLPPGPPKPASGQYLDSRR